jgi:hypothetical protein
MRSRDPHVSRSDPSSSRSDTSSASSPREPHIDQAVATDFVDALLRRTNRLLDDSIAAVGRIRTHTRETDQQIEASRAFLADSYHTLAVLRRDRSKKN